MLVKEKLITLESIIVITGRISLLNFWGGSSNVVAWLFDILVATLSILKLKIINSFVYVCRNSKDFES